MPTTVTGKITGTGKTIMSWEPAPAAGGRGVFGGGWRTAATNVMEYVEITTLSNAFPFGQLAVLARSRASLSNGSIGIFAGGVGNETLIDRIIISSASDSTVFGNLSFEKGSRPGTSNGSTDRGIMAGGFSGSPRDVIDYIEISSDGDSVDFGDLRLATTDMSAASNGINDRALFAGGDAALGVGVTTNIHYVTISSLGISTDFGNLWSPETRGVGTSNDTNDAALFIGGLHTTLPATSIDYVTISTLSNATPFGDLDIARSNLATTSNGTGDTAVIGGGRLVDPVWTDVIETVGISSPANATAFGTLGALITRVSATSDGFE